MGHVLEDFNVLHIHESFVFITMVFIVTKSRPRLMAHVDNISEGSRPIAFEGKNLS